MTEAMKRDFRLVVKEAVSDAANMGWTGQGFFDSGAAETFVAEVVAQHELLIKRARSEAYRDAASVVTNGFSYPSIHNILTKKAQDCEK